VEVRFFATFRNLTGQSACHLDRPPARLRGVLDLLAARYGDEFRRAVFQGGALSPVVILLVNGQHVAHTGGLDTPIHDGDRLSVFPMVAGG
jgi:sulfur-carrier protein